MERHRGKWFPSHDDEFQGAEETSRYNMLIGQAIQGDPVARAGLEQIEADEAFRESEAWKLYIQSVQSKK